MIFIIAFILPVVLLAGIFLGVTGTLRLIPKGRTVNIDYRQRWEDAVALLGEGQLTDEQVRKISPEPSRVAVIHDKPTPEILRTLHSMASWDRKTIEIQRARNGLPPVDDLAGMASWDKKAVLLARAEAG